MSDATITPNGSQEKPKTPQPKNQTSAKTRTRKQQKDYLDPAKITEVPKPTEEVAEGIEFWTLTANMVSDRRRTQNLPTLDIAKNLVHLAQKVIAPVTKKFGPLHFEAYRSRHTEQALKALPGFQPAQGEHTAGIAVDLRAADGDPVALARWIEKNIKGLELVRVERHSPNRHGSGWVHVCVSPPWHRRKPRGLVQREYWSPTLRRWQTRSGLGE